jgi:hypothetical protein
MPHRSNLLCHCFADLPRVAQDRGVFVPIGRDLSEEFIDACIEGAAAGEISKPATHGIAQGELNAGRLGAQPAVELGIGRVGDLHCLQ